MTSFSPPIVLSAVLATLTFGAGSFVSGALQESASSSGRSSQPAVSKVPPGHSEHKAAAKSLDVQLRELQQKVAQLEVALKQAHRGPNAASRQQSGQHGHGRHAAQASDSKPESPEMMKNMAGKGMKRMGGGKMMSGMKTGMNGPPDMSRMSGMAMMGRGMKRMAMMGQQPGMGGMEMPSALPGYPGASHIYHIGATGFFLDHNEHITLSIEQQTKLNRIKTDALLKQDEFDRGIQEAEQQLWKLTGSDMPDITKIDAVVRKIEKLRGDQRIALIRSVGQAAGVLTDEQRSVLAGQLPSGHSSQNDRSEADAP